MQAVISMIHTLHVLTATYIFQKICDHTQRPRKSPSNHLVGYFLDRVMTNFPDLILYPRNRPPNPHRILHNMILISCRSVPQNRIVAAAIEELI